MAHLVNPISFRLGYNRYWSSLWASSTKNVASFNIRDILISRYITRTFERNQELLRSSWSLANLKIFSVSSFVFIFFFLKYQQFNISELFSVFRVWWSKFLNKHKTVKITKKQRYLELKRLKLLKKHMKNGIKQKRRIFYKHNFKSLFVYPTKWLFKKARPVVSFTYKDFEFLKKYKDYEFLKKVYFKSIYSHLSKKNDLFNLLRRNFLFERKYIASRIYKYAYIPTLASVRYARYDSFSKLHDLYLNNYLLPSFIPLKWNTVRIEKPFRDRIPRSIILTYDMHSLYWMNVYFTRLLKVERKKKMRRDFRNSFIDRWIQSSHYNKSVKLRNLFCSLFLKRKYFALNILKQMKKKSLSPKLITKIRKRGFTTSSFKVMARKYKLSRNFKFFIGSKVPLTGKRRVLFFKINFFKLFYLIYYFLFFKYKILFFKRIFFYDLKKFFGLRTHVYIYSVLLPIESFTARYVARFIRLKLLHKYPLRNIIRLMVDKLNLAIIASEINGFKLQFSGRFTRKDRATYAWKRFGKVTLNSVAERVDYSLVLVILVNSMCGLKVWLSRPSVIQRTLIF